MKRFVFNKTNTITFIIATLVMIAGYIIMATGDNTISVILLTVSYLFLFPLSIVIGFHFAQKRIKNNEKN